MPEPDTHRPRCHRCLRPAAMCHCARLPSVTTRTRVVILQHPHERTHPFGTVRAAEIQRWVKSGEYDKILAGDYRRRSDASTPPLSDDYVDAAGYYSQQARGAVDSFNEVINRARDAFNSAFKGPSGT